MYCFKPDNLEKFKEILEGEYERTKDIIEDYDYADGFVVVVYKPNPVKKIYKKWKKDSILKLSFFSKDFLKQFLY
jgi:hypothetical protein